MTKYTIGEIFGSSGATLYKNPSDQTVCYTYPELVTLAERKFFLLSKHFVFFTVPPVCRPKGVKVYGVAKMETAHIACNVEANPHEVSFR